MSAARRRPPPGHNLVLSGDIGPLHSVVARRVAARLSMPYVDIGTLLELRHELGVEEIRSRFGEARLKTLEAEMLAEALLQREAVIRVSGYRLAQGDWLRQFQETSLVICLSASLDSVLQSLHQALGARYHDPDERALALGQLGRDWTLRGRPGILELDTTGLDLPEIVTAIIRLRQEALPQEAIR